MNMESKSHYRYHRYDEIGAKHIRNFKFEGVEPPPKIYKDENDIEWKKGSGPLPTHIYEKVASIVSKTWIGRPKSIETKKKMSDAKLGRKFSETHKENMSKSSRRRRDRKSTTEST